MFDMREISRKHFREKLKFVVCLKHNKEFADKMFALRYDLVLVHN